MSDLSSIFPWEQDGVLHLHQALNSQSPSISQPPSTQTVSYKTLLYPSQSGQLEGQETLDLSIASTLPSYSPYSPPPSRMTILPPRHAVMSHPMCSQPAGNGQEGRQTGDSLDLIPGYREEQEERRIRKQIKDLEEERPCRVCWEKAGKHSYYGGQVIQLSVEGKYNVIFFQVCPSCRAFFRRSVQSGHNATYFCVKDGNCEVNLKTRKNCQFCRYKLCEAAGMKTTWVLTEEERKLKFKGKGKRKRTPTGENTQSLDETNNTFTETDLCQINTYIAASEYWEISKVNDMNTELIRKIIR